MIMIEKTRVVCWFSCGRASAVAAKMALAKYAGKLPVHIVYCASVEDDEHPDNRRFIVDCEKWYGQPIERLYSDKYTGIYDVFDKTGWLVGPAGARCTTELKKKMRQQYEDIDRDIQIFGFGPGELPRWERFRKINWEINAEAPLIDGGISNVDCTHRLIDAEIAIPVMYRMGYTNNNCIGCVKGGIGYWNKIRVDFPDAWAKMVAQERKMGVRVQKYTITVEGKRVRTRMYLDEIPPHVGRYDKEPAWECGVGCAPPSDDESVG